MADLTWDCACGQTNSSRAPTCTSCGRVPTVAPASPGQDAQGPGVRSRKPLPFSASARGPVVPPTSEAHLGAAPGALAPLRPVEAPRAPTSPPLPARPHPPQEGAPASEPSGAEPPGAEPPGAEPPGAEPPGAEPPVAEPPRKRPSFFDPEPDPDDVAARAAAQRPKWWTTPAARAAIAGLIVALAVLIYVIVNTGNAKAPDQTPAGSSAPLHQARPTAAVVRSGQTVVAIPPVQDANNAA